MTQNSWNSPYNNADGELLIGNTSNAKPQVGTLTSSESTIVVSYSNPNLVINAHASSHKSSFLAYLSSTVTNVTGDETEYNILFDSEDYDTGGDFDTSTGRFISPQDGKYLFTGGVVLGGIDATHTRMVGSILQFTSGLSLVNVVRMQDDSPTGTANVNNEISYSGQAIFDMSATDIVLIRVTVGIPANPKSIDVLGNSINSTKTSFFSGMQLI